MEIVSPVQLPYRTSNDPKNCLSQPLESWMKMQMRISIAGALCKNMIFHCVSTSGNSPLLTLNDRTILHINRTRFTNWPPYIHLNLPPERKTRNECEIAFLSIFWKNCVPAVGAVPTVYLREERYTRGNHSQKRMITKMRQAISKKGKMMPRLSHRRWGAIRTRELPDYNTSV